MTPGDAAPAVATKPTRSSTKGSAKDAFIWSDALLLEEQLSEDERMVRDTARNYAQDKLMSRVQHAFRHEHFDREIMTEMGELGLLGSTIEGYGCAGVNYVSYGLVARESSASTPATAPRSACNRAWSCTRSTPTAARHSARSTCPSWRAANGSAVSA